jgi:hypothetical protein
MDSQSTMDLFCNPKLVQRIYKFDEAMKLKSNGGTMMVSCKAKIEGCNRDVWFSKDDATTNIIALSNLMKQHRVTYNSEDQMFVVHRENQNKPNRCTKVVSIILIPKTCVFLSTVSGNSKGFSQQQIKGAETARTPIHEGLQMGHPSKPDQ